MTISAGVREGFADPSAKGQRSDGEIWYENMLSSLSSAHIPAFDGVRATAITMVILYHFGFDWAAGALGVMIFFVLSGFLITWLLIKENEASGAIALGSFFKRRLVRLLPALYAYWVFCIALYLVRGHYIDWKMAVSSLFFVSNYYIGTSHPPTGPFTDTWALGAEMQFYILWPVILWYFRNDLVKLTKIAICFIVLSWLVRGALHLVLQVDQSYIYHAFEARLDQFMVGALVALMFKRRLLVNFWYSVGKRYWAPAVTILLLIASGYLEFIDHSLFYRHIIGYSVNPFLIAILFIQLVALSEKPVWNVLDSKAVCYIGTISYSLFLYQQLTVYTARKVSESFPILAQVVFAYAVTVAFGIASYYLIEKPMRRIR